MVEGDNGGDVCEVIELTEYLPPGGRSGALNGDRFSRFGVLGRGESRLILRT